MQKNKAMETMRAVEFKSTIQENSILIPRRLQPQLIAVRDRNVRVVVFMEDSDVYDERAFRQMTKSQFLKGYAASDAVYDL